MWALCGMWRRGTKGSGRGLGKAFETFGVGTLGM